MLYWSGMGKTSAAPKSTPHSFNGGDSSSSPAESRSARNAFFVMTLNMSWQLAIVVVVPLALGAWLDQKFDTGNLWVFVGLAVALVASTAVVWRIVQQASRLPVPKLTNAQRRAIRKQYEEEDDE